MVRLQVRASILLATHVISAALCLLVQLALAMPFCIPLKIECSGFVTTSCINDLIMKYDLPVQCTITPPATSINVPHCSQNIINPTT